MTDTRVLFVLVGLTAIGVALNIPTITVFGGMAACIAAFVWIARRCPLCAWMLLGFIRGLTGGGRRW